MRSALTFVHHINTMAENRNPGVTLSISSLTWSELKSPAWRNEVSSLLIAMDYMPFRSVKYTTEPNGNVLMVMVTRPGIIVVDPIHKYLSPSWWNRIKTRFYRP